jgi:low affinity Fe/Cu permease
VAGELFRKAAFKTASVVGSHWAFLFAVAVIVAWAATGPMFHFSDTWQLVINTGTTIVTFLMVFLIQASQNRDSRALQLKLDELIRAQRQARNIFADIEDASEEELNRFHREFKELRKRGMPSDEAAARAAKAFDDEDADKEDARKSADVGPHARRR